MSEHAIAQPQKANVPQEATIHAGALEHRAVNQPEPTTLPGRLFDAVSSTFMEPRFAHDFSRVRLRAEQPMVQRLPRNERPASTPAIAGPTVWEAPTPEPTAEPAGPTTEATSTPAPAEPTTEPATPSETPAPGLLVEDSVDELAPGQMRRSDFLAQLRTEVTRTAEAAMAGTDRTTADCPYLGYWFGYYSRQDSLHIERAIHRYAPETASATTAGDYIPRVAARVGRSVEVWATTGEITGVPEGVPMGLPGMGLLGGVGRLLSGVGSIFFKARDGGARAANDPQAIQRQLGEGRPLDSGVRTRMESAFGMDFAHVRTHTDSAAAGLSSRFNAHAFTVGEHVAFGAGEYQPGTLVGDALIAHELAHVVQQGGSSNPAASKIMGDTSYSALERDADKSAIGVVSSLWNNTKTGCINMTRVVVPRLRSGLRLQGCNRNRAQPCVSPHAVQNGPRHAPINNAGAVGMDIDITVLSNGSLNGVQDSEKVSPTVDPTGSFAGFPATAGQTSGFMPAANIPPDRHTFPKALIIDRADNHSGDGTISFLQLDVFKQPACNINNPRVIPGSGYRIKHFITTGPGTKIMCKTEKSAEAVTVDGFNANAGPSPTYHEDNEVRA